MPASTRHATSVADLSAAHLGQHVELELPRGETATGTLRGVEHALTRHGEHTALLRLTDRPRGVTRTVLVAGHTPVRFSARDDLAERVLQACDQRRVFPQDLAGGWRAEGWAQAVEHVRQVVTEHQNRTTEESEQR